MTVGENEDASTQFCPFLGYLNDPETHQAFGSHSNYCHRCKTAPDLVNLEHQGAFCLSSEYVHCQVYVTGNEKPFPRTLHARSASVQKPWHRKRFGWYLVFLLVGLVLLSAGYWFAARRAAQSPITQATVTPYASSTPTLKPTKMRVSGVPKSAADTSSGTITPTLRPKQLFTVLTLTPSPAVSQVITHRLNTPIGETEKYLIHRVVRGENLDILARRHNTSVTAILGVNYQKVSPVWVGQIIIIPIDRTSLKGLPVLEPFQVKESDIPSDELAASLNIDLSVFQYLNQLADNQVLRKGDWFLIPRKR